MLESLAYGLHRRCAGYASRHFGLPPQATCICNDARYFIFDTEFLPVN